MFLQHLDHTGNNSVYNLLISFGKFAMISKKKTHNKKIPKASTALLRFLRNSVYKILLFGLIGLHGLCYHQKGTISPQLCIQCSREAFSNYRNYVINNAQTICSLAVNQLSRRYFLYISAASTSQSPKINDTVFETDRLYSISEFNKYLQSDSEYLQSEFNRFLYNVLWSICGSDDHWSSGRGSCLQFPNLASYYAGASVISAKSIKDCNKAICTDIILGNRIAASSQSNSILEDLVTPGKAWKFEGQGQVIVRLTLQALIIGFTIHHPPKAVLQTGFFASAPKDIQLYGMRSEMDTHPFFFGNFTYLEDLSAQTFIPQYFSGTPFSFVKLHILSNHGNPTYTALHRIEVYGLTSHQPWFLEQQNSKPSDQSDQKMIREKLVNNHLIVGKNV